VPETPHAAPPPAPGEKGWDRELSLKAIAWTAISLAVLLVVTVALMWAMSLGLRKMIAKEDPPPPVLPEEATQPLPPEPRLQTAPEAELSQMRAEEDRRLHSYAWVDQGAGVARIPVERAIEILLERGIDAGVPK
jgi:hypothetical protein